MVIGPTGNVEIRNSILSIINASDIGYNVSKLGWTSSDGRGT